MKQAIAIQIFILCVLLAYWIALVCGVNIPADNAAEVSAGKDVLLTLLSAGSLASMIQTANQKLVKGDDPNEKPTPNVPPDSAGN